MSFHCAILTTDLVTNTTDVSLSAVSADTDIRCRTKKAKFPNNTDTLDLEMAAWLPSYITSEDEEHYCTTAAYYRCKVKST